MLASVSPRFTTYRVSVGDGSGVGLKGRFPDGTADEVSAGDGVAAGTGEHAATRSDTTIAPDAAARAGARPAGPRPIRRPAVRPTARRGARLDGAPAASIALHRTPALL